MLRAAIPAILAATALTGCIHGAERNYNTHRDTTIGQELLDLQAAYDKGVISGDEYQRVKARLLNEQ